MARTKGDPKKDAPKKDVARTKAAPKNGDGRDRSRSRPPKKGDGRDRSRAPSPDAVPPPIEVRATDPDAPHPMEVPPCGLGWRCPPVVNQEVFGWDPWALQRYWDRRAEEKEEEPFGWCD